MNLYKGFYQKLLDFPSQQEKYIFRKTFPQYLSISGQLRLRGERTEAHGVVARVHAYGLGGEVEGAAAPFVGEIHGAEVVHGLPEVIAISDGRDRVRAIVLRDGPHVRPLRPRTQRDPIDFVIRGRHRGRANLGTEPIDTDRSYT